MNRIPSQTFVNTAITLVVLKMGSGGQNYLHSKAHGGDLKLRTDPRFEAFLKDDFDAAQFASNALIDKQTTVQAQIDYLQQGIALLDSQLRHLVLQHRSELTAHAGRLGHTDASIQRLTLSVRSLQSVATRVQADVLEPYQQVAAKTSQLSNVQRTVDLLRHAIHRVKLVERLRAEIGEGDGPTDIISVGKAARLLNDIRAADKEADLTGTVLLNNEAEFMAKADAIIRARIDTALRSGLDSLSQADVGSALQALYNLQELRSAVEEQIQLSAESLGRTFAAAMDPRKLSSSTSSGALRSLQGTTTRVQDALWDRLREACDVLWRAGVAAWHLQRVLMKKRDPLTYELFINVVAPTERDQLPLERFWEAATTSVGNSFKSALSAQRSGIVRDTLVASYPRLAGMLENTCVRITKDTSSREAPDALTSSQTAGLLATPQDAEEAYLSGVAARLQGAVAATFQGGTRALPTAADVQGLIARIHEEMKAASSGGDRLTVLVSAVVGSAVHAAANRAEMMASGGPELRTIGSGCSTAQSRNIAICNALHDLHRSITGLISRVPAPAAEALSRPLDGLQAMAIYVVAPIFRGMVEAAQDRMLRMHSLNFGGDDDTEDAVLETSGYMREVVRLLGTYRVDYLSKFVPPPTLGGSKLAGPSVAGVLTDRMAARTLIFFVRHAALVRPLSRVGKLQLAKDSAELEAAVTQYLAAADHTALGPPLRSLRALRHLLFTETQNILNSSVRDDIQPVVLMHHLFCRAPDALKSPHVRSKLSPSQYSLWLDEHTQHDAVKHVKAAVDAAAGKLTAASDHEVLDVLRSLIAATGATQ